MEIFESASLYILSFVPNFSTSLLHKAPNSFTMTQVKTLLGQGQEAAMLWLVCIYKCTSNFRMSVLGLTKSASASKS